MRKNKSKGKSGWVVIQKSLAPSAADLVYYAAFRKKRSKKNWVVDLTSWTSNLGHAKVWKRLEAAAREANRRLATGYYLSTHEVLLGWVEPGGSLHEMPIMDEMEKHTVESSELRERMVKVTNDPGTAADMTTSFHQLDSLNRPIEELLTLRSGADEIVKTLTLTYKNGWRKTYEILDEEVTLFNEHVEKKGT